MLPTDDVARLGRSQGIAISPIAAATSLWQLVQARLRGAAPPAAASPGRAGCTAQT
jgi:hypothetical protein